MFVKVLESELVLPPEKLRPYLYRVAWSTYLDHYRRQQRLQKLITRYLGPAIPVSSPPIKDYLALVVALQKLRPRDQQLLVYRYVDQWAIDRIAAELGITVAAVKMRLQRVQHQLEKQLRRGYR